MNTQHFSLYLPSRTKIWCTYAPAERADTLPLFLLYPLHVLYGSHSHNKLVVRYGPCAIIPEDFNSFFRPCFKPAMQRQYRKFETNIPRKGIAQSQFPHSYVCERFIYSGDWSIYSDAGKYMDQSCGNILIFFWEYINEIFVAVCRQTSYTFLRLLLAVYNYL